MPRNTGAPTLQHLFGREPFLPPGQSLHPGEVQRSLCPDPPGAPPALSLPSCASLGCSRAMGGRNATARNCGTCKLAGINLLGRS